ncbi:MAG: hypothetical protein FWB96_02195 [Defluviitaleaceae bacterium]|nr:hypothetical protein [Defluviitaleaceae bacterium]MCL2262348.1 hypothetical protein [Defluviitaleaceae bacterium]
MTYNLKDNYGNVSFGSNSTNIINHGVSPNNDLAVDVERIIPRIQSLSIPEDKSNQLVNYLKDAVVAESEEDKLACKYGFNGFCAGAGSLVKEAVGMLAKIASIATFFGLNG